MWSRKPQKTASINVGSYTAHGWRLELFNPKVLSYHKSLNMMSLRAFKRTINGFRTVFHTLLKHPEILPMIHTCIMWGLSLVHSPHGSSHAFHFLSCSQCVTCIRMDILRIDVVHQPPFLPITPPQNTICWILPIATIDSEAFRPFANQINYVTLIPHTTQLGQKVQLTIVVVALILGTIHQSETNLHEPSLEQPFNTSHKLSLINETSKLEHHT